MNISNLAEMYWRTCSVLRRSTHNFRPPRSAWLVLVFLGLGNEREINVVWYDVYIYIYMIWRNEKKKKAWKSEGWSAIFPDFPVMFFLQPVYSNCLQRCEPCKPELARLANAKGNARCCCSYICIITIITISSIIFFFILSSPAVYKWNKQ